MARKALLALVCGFLLAACGQASRPGPAPGTSSSPPPQSAAAAVSATPAAAPGCGTYCQQAGNSAGTGQPGYPCPTAGCQQCPPGNCVSLGSAGATVTNGVATVRLSCHLSTACHGAFLLCLPFALCENGPSDGAGGRLAGSDFVVPPGATRDVGVALTTLGKQVVSGPGGFSATVLVDLLDYGSVLNTTGSATGDFSLTSTDPPTFPAGATASCGGTVFVGPDTSCPFAENVKKAYSKSTGFGNASVSAVSPVTGRTYVMRCGGEWLHVCRGGTNALVEFYS